MDVISALLRRPRDAYGVAIADEITEATRRSVSIGALYTTLERLERKGYVSSGWGEPTAARGGRRKRYYKVEGAGMEAYRRTEARHAPAFGRLNLAEA